MSDSITEITNTLSDLIDLFRDGPLKTLGGFPRNLYLPALYDLFSLYFAHYPLTFLMFLWLPRPQAPVSFRRRNMERGATAPCAQRSRKEGGLGTRQTLHVHCPEDLQDRSDKPMSAAGSLVNLDQ